MKKKKTNVYFYNTTIDYLENERKVEATVSACIDLTKIENFDELVKLSEVKEYIDQISQDGKVYVTCIGIAKCSDEDEYLPEYGKNLALSKAQHKILKIATNIYQEFITIIYNYTEHLYGCFDKVIVANSHSNMHICNLLDFQYDEQFKKCLNNEASYVNDFLYIKDKQLITEINNHEEYCSI